MKISQLAIQRFELFLPKYGTNPWGHCRNQVINDYRTLDITDLILMTAIFLTICRRDQLIEIIEKIYSPIFRLYRASDFTKLVTLPHKRLHQFLELF